MAAIAGLLLVGATHSSATAHRLKTSSIKVYASAGSISIILSRIG